jgi:hypothetical protein
MRFKILRSGMLRTMQFDRVVSSLGAVQRHVMAV